MVSHLWSLPCSVTSPRAVFTCAIVSGTDRPMCRQQNQCDKQLAAAFSCGTHNQGPSVEAMLSLHNWISACLQNWTYRCVARLRGVLGVAGGSGQPGDPADRGGVLLEYRPARFAALWLRHPPCRHGPGRPHPGGGPLCGWPRSGMPLSSSIRSLPADDCRGCH